MKIEFKLNVTKERESKMLEYFNLFTRALEIGENETIVDLKINDVLVEEIVHTY